MPPRVRLTSDGLVKVKVPGRKSQLFKVPFLDSYRKRAFRNLRYVLEKLDFKIVGEGVKDRCVDLNFEGTPVKVNVRDRVLLTEFNPRRFARDYPALTKSVYIVTFIYCGQGNFDTLFIYEKEEERKALKEFLKKTFNPSYTSAFLNDAAPQRKEEPKKETPKIIKSEEKKPTVEAEAPKKNEAHKPKKRTRKRPKKKQIEEPVEPSIEEIKKRISNYRPTSFKEHLAFKRYEEALKASPDKEEDIHRAFFSLITGKNDLKDFYYQLYSLAPKLIERLELPYLPRF